MGGCGVWISFDCYLVCGVWFLFVFRLPDVWAWFVWLVCLLVWLVLYRADAPFPIFIGEVLSGFSLSLEALASCILGCLWGIALLVINS